MNREPVYELTVVPSLCTFVTALAIAALSGFLHRPAAAETSFAAPYFSFNVGRDPRIVAIGDLNGDGRPDVVTTNNAASTVSVLLGNGDGTLDLASDYATASDPFASALGDLDADGRLDLAVANLSGTVSVLLGNGDGTLGARTDYATGDAPASVAIGDVNGDGRPDLAVANFSSGTVSVLPGIGDGTFGAKTDLTSPDPLKVALADLNGDGMLDLTVGASSSGISVRLGNGDGTFGASSDYLDGGIFVIGDVNGDGKPDLTTVSAVRLGNGDGSFGDPLGYVGGSSSMALGDLNLDGKTDLAVANTVTVSVLPGNGDGTFGAGHDFNTGYYPISVAVADLSGDDKLDLVVSNLNSSTVSTLLGHGDGNFGDPSDHGTGEAPYSVAIGDLNGDGRSDLVAANGSANSVSVLLGQAGGALGLETRFGAGPGPYSVAIGDLNGDGRPDLAVTNNVDFYLPGHSVSVLLGHGDGTFGAATAYPTADYPVTVVIADLNADGRLDLAVANHGVYPTPGHTVSVLLGHGDGTFGVTNDFEAGSYPASLASADLNGDGKPDLVTANAVGANVSVLLGHGDGTFGAPTDFGASFAYGVAIGDLDGDGALDLATANDDVTVFRGHGDGTFGAGADVATGYGATSVAIADLDADGELDIATSNRSFSASVLLGHGDGTFATHRDYGTGNFPVSVAIGDLNGDGWPDLAVPNSASSTVTVLVNRGDFVTAVLLSLFEGSWSTEGIAIRWRFGARASFLDARLERSDEPRGPWVHVDGQRRDAGETSALLDGDVEAGRAYYYRLIARQTDGRVTIFRPILVAADAPSRRFELQPIAPSPARDVAHIAFVVAREAHVRLSLLDVQGRRVALLADADHRPGRYAVDWNGGDAHGRAPAGVYYVRYEWPGASSVRRLLLLH